MSEVIPEIPGSPLDILLSINGCLASQSLFVRLWISDADNCKTDSYGNYYPNRKTPMVAIFQLLEISESPKNSTVLYQSPMLYVIFDFIKSEFGQRTYDKLGLNKFDNLFLYDRGD